MKSAKEEQLIEAALNAKDYRSFISGALVAMAKDGAKPNMAAVSRKAGFSSRSFIGDVLEGRRRLSAGSYPKMVKALALPPKLKAYFHLLVVREEEELNFEGLKSHQIDSKLVEIRSKLESSLSTQQIEEQAVEVMYKGRDMLDCFAALNADKGASIDDVSARTNFPREMVEHLIRHFLAKKIVVEKDGLYFAPNPLLLFQNLGEQQGAKNLYLQTMDELRRKVSSGFHNKDRQFNQAVFLVDRSRMMELRKRLSEVVQEFVEQGESTDGNAIAKLIVGFYI